MHTSFSLHDVVEFLNHADTHGLMPTATAQALAVAVRSVFGVLDADEQSSLPLHDVDGVIRRFENKRAGDFSPSSLKEYARRVHRAVDLYVRWKNDPSAFSVATRSTGAQRTVGPVYASAFPIRTGHVVAIANIPSDMTAQEAERLSQFVRLLGAS